MIDPKLLRQSTAAVAANLARRGYDLDVQAFLALEARRKSLQAEADELRNTRNTRSKAIGRAKAQGEDVQPLLDEVADLGARLKSAEEALAVEQVVLQALHAADPARLPSVLVRDGRVRALWSLDGDERSRYQQWRAADGGRGPAPVQLAVERFLAEGREPGPAAPGPAG